MRVLALCLALAPSVVAQDAVTLRPGDPALDLAALALADYTLAVEVAGPEAQSLGTIAETYRLDGDVLTIVAQADVPMAGAPARDSTRLRWPSLAPLSNDVVGGGEVATASYQDGQVTGAYGTDGRAPLPFAFDLQRPVFAPAALPLVVRALPLTPGYRAVVPTFSAEDRFKEAVLTVAGPETVTLPDGSVVQAVAVTRTGGGGLTRGMPQRHYVDPVTRQIVLTTMDAPGMAIRFVPLTEAEVAARQAQAAQAQATAEAVRAASTGLRPGDDTLDLDAIGSESVSLVIRLVQPMQQDAGTESRAVVVDRAAGTITLTTDTNIAMVGQRLQSTLVAAYPSFAPISLVQDDGTGRTELAFADGRVTGTDEGETVDRALDAAVFANAWLPVVVRTLPFAEGYSAVFHGYSAGDGVVETLLTVTGQETVEAPDGERTAWVVQADRDGTVLTIRVDAESRALLGYGLSPQPGVRIEFVAE